MCFVDFGVHSFTVGGGSGRGCRVSVTAKSAYIVRSNKVPGTMSTTVVLSVSTN